MCMTNADQGSWRLNNDFLDTEAGDVQKKNLVNQVVFSTAGELLPQSGKNELRELGSASTG